LPILSSFFLEEVLVLAGFVVLFSLMELLCRYPSHARMWLAPMRTSLVDQKQQEYQHSMADWMSFLQETSDHYNVDMSVLSNHYRTEQKKYFLQVG
jgi:hypothetical protein